MTPLSVHSGTPSQYLGRGGAPSGSAGAYQSSAGSFGLVATLERGQKVDLLAATGTAPPAGIDPAPDRAGGASRAIRLVVVELRADRIGGTRAQALGDVHAQPAGRFRGLRFHRRIGRCLQVGKSALEIAGGAGLAEQVARVLAGMDIESIEEAGSVLHIRLSRDAKMPALARLATLGEAMRDLHVREPSLEDVFFGYRS